jgi:hypothetical protein
VIDTQTMVRELCDAHVHREHVERSTSTATAQSRCTARTGPPSSHPSSTSSRTPCTTSATGKTPAAQVRSPSRPRRSTPRHAEPDQRPGVRVGTAVDPCRYRPGGVRAHSEHARLPAVEPEAWVLPSAHPRAPDRPVVDVGQAHDRMGPACDEARRHVSGMRQARWATGQARRRPAVRHVRRLRDHLARSRDRAAGHPPQGRGRMCRGGVRPPGQPHDPGVRHDVPRLDTIQFTRDSPTSG